MGAAACGATITPAITTTSTPAVAVHLLLGGTRIATVRPPNQAATTAAFAEVLYYHRDYQGSVIGTSRRGAGVDGLSGAKYRYTPYGQLDKVTGVTAQRLPVFHGLNGVTVAETEGYAWDVQDQLRQVRTAGSVSEVMDFDPTGLPLYRRAGPAATRSSRPAPGKRAAPPERVR
jgi:hypothetical protein